MNQRTKSKLRLASNPGTDRWLLEALIRSTFRSDHRGLLEGFVDLYLTARNCDSAQTPLGDEPVRLRNHEAQDPTGGFRRFSMNQNHLRRSDRTRN